MSERLNNSGSNADSGGKSWDDLMTTAGFSYQDYDTGKELPKKTHDAMDAVIADALSNSQEEQSIGDQKPSLADRVKMREAEMSDDETDYRGPYSTDKHAADDSSSVGFFAALGDKLDTPGKKAGAALAAVALVATIGGIGAYVSSKNKQETGQANANVLPAESPSSVEHDGDHPNSDADNSNASTDNLSCNVSSNDAVNEQGVSTDVLNGTKCDVIKSQDGTKFKIHPYTDSSTNAYTVKDDAIEISFRIPKQNNEYSHASYSVRIFDKNTYGWDVVPYEPGWSVADYKEHQEDLMVSVLGGEDKDGSMSELWSMNTAGGLDIYSSVQQVGDDVVYMCITSDSYSATIIERIKQLTKIEY